MVTKPTIERMEDTLGGEKKSPVERQGRGKGTRFLGLYLVIYLFYFINGKYLILYIRSFKDSVLRLMHVFVVLCSG